MYAVGFWRVGTQVATLVVPQDQIEHAKMGVSSMSKYATSLPPPAAGRMFRIFTVMVSGGSGTRSGLSRGVQSGW